MSVVNNVTKMDTRKCARGRGSLVDLCSTRWVMPRHQFLQIILMEIEGRALSLESWVCWLVLLVA
jgi:hypothetical protein